MDSLVGHSISVFLAFFAVMNPIANAAVFVSLTSDEDDASRKRTARKSVFTAFCIILFFCLLGKAIFDLFGITLPALRIAGGVLIFLVGYQMLHGESSKIHSPRVKSPDEPGDGDVAISPLAVPILAGPGTIATAMNYSATGSLVDSAVTILAFTVLTAITYVAFLSGERIVKLLGHGGMDIVTRLMGMILAVVGVQMLIQGVHDAKHLF